jgi:hypothetical protein
MAVQMGNIRGVPVKFDSVGHNDEYTDVVYTLSTESRTAFLPKSSPLGTSWSSKNFTQ